MTPREQECTVGDYVTLVRGTTYKGLLVGQPGPALLGLGSIEPGGGFREGHYKTYGGDCPKKLMLFPGDLYVSLKGATKDGSMIGSIACVPGTIQSGRLTQDTVKLEFRNQELKEISNYLYWLLRTPHYRTALFETLQENRSRILEIADKHGAFNVRVFGSVVRGEDTPESDIDFLIDYDREKVTPWFPGGLLMDLQDLLGRYLNVGA